MCLPVFANLVLKGRGINQVKQKENISQQTEILTAYCKNET